MSNYRTYGYPVQPGMERRNDCFCDSKMKSALPKDTVCAMAYVPYQTGNDIYPSEKALLCGTVFPVLDKPFMAGWLK